MKATLSLALTLTTMLTTSTLAVTYSVSPRGNDANPGSAERPFATPQKALDVAQPGDRIVVEPGVYRGRLKVKTSGTKDRPIVFEGKHGAVLDGGDVIRGFEPAPEMGPGVWKHTQFPYNPWSMTWNNRYLLKALKETYHPKDQSGMEPTVRSFFGKRGDDAWWDTLEAMYAYLNDTCYVRFRDGRNPDDEDVTFAPGTSDGGLGRPAVIELDNKRFITIRGFYIRNADAGVTLYNDSSDNIVEHCYMTGGKANVIVADDLGRGDRNVIRYNQLTVNYVWPDFGHPWHDPVHHRFWEITKANSFGDRVAIYLWGANDTQVYGNHFFRVWDGIDTKKTDNATETGKRIKIHHNLIQSAADDAMCWGASEIDGEFNDNLMYSVNDLRFCFYDWAVGPVYIYRNRMHSLPEDPKGGSFYIPFYGTGDAEVFFYHNSFSTNGAVMHPSLHNESLPRFWTINNVLSSRLEPFDGSKDDGYWYGKGFVLTDYNWMGGEAASLQGKPWLGEHNILAPAQRLWDKDEPSFVVDAKSPVRGKGLDLSKTFTIAGRTHEGGLPGMSSGYFKGSAPDLGALQHGEEKTLAAPTAAKATRRGEVIEVSWEHDGRGVQVFSVERSEDGKVFTVAGQAKAGENTFVDFFNLRPKHKYWYRVRAIDFDGGPWVSGYSGIVPIE